MLKINIKKLPKSELEIEGEIEIDAFEAYFSKALKKIGEKLWHVVYIEEEKIIKVVTIYYE